MKPCLSLFQEILRDPVIEIDINDLVDSIKIGMANDRASQKWKETAQKFLEGGECHSHMETILAVISDHLWQAAELTEKARSLSGKEKKDAYVTALTYDASNQEANAVLLEILCEDFKNGAAAMEGYHRHLSFRYFRRLMSCAPTLKDLWEAYQTSPYNKFYWSAPTYIMDGEWVYKFQSEGGYGKIFIGTDGTKYQVRKISTQGVDQGYLLEISILDFLGSTKFEDHPACPFIVDAIGYRILQKEAYIDMEYIDPLTRFIKMVPLPERASHILPIAFQLFAGLAFLHKHRICHSDLKIPNVLYDPKQRKLRIIDFGLAHVICDPSMTFETSVASTFNASNIIGNYFQMPPEALLCESNESCELMHKRTCWNSSIDIWNVGLILARLLGYMVKYTLDANTPATAAQTFQDVLDTIDQPETLEEWNANNFECSQISETSQFNRFRKSSNTIMTFLQDKYSENAEVMALLPLIQQCLAPTPKQRIYARDALQHPVFSSILSQYVTPRYFKYLITPFTKEEFIKMRMKQYPSPVFNRSWVNRNNAKMRTRFCYSVKTNIPDDYHLACQTLYLYDVHRWMQCQASNPPRISMEFEPTHSVMVADIWLGRKNKREELNPLQVQTFLEFVHPDRLLGLSFYDFVVLQDIKMKPEKIFQIMCKPNFIFASYLDHLIFD